MSFQKKIFFYILINLLIFLFLEIIFTVFFLLHSSNYYGPLARFFSSIENNESDYISYAVKYDKLTGKYVPGKYNYNENVYTVNKSGFIGPDFEIDNKTDCRIIALGGSTTAGIESKKSYPEILEENLNKDNYDCEVLNFGFAGKGLNFLENLFLKDGIRYNPNTIIIMSNRNSIMYDSYVNSSAPSDVIENKYDLFIYKIKHILYSEVLTYRFMYLGFNKSVSLFFNEEDKILSPFDSRSYHLKDYFKNRYKNQILKINSFCKANGINLVLVKQGFFIDPDFQKKILKLSKDEIIEKLNKYDKDKNLDKLNLFWIYSNAILNKTLDEVKKIDSNIIVIDPTTEFYAKNKKDYFFPDGLHLNIKGNRVIAGKIFDSLISNKIINN